MDRLGAAQHKAHDPLRDVVIAHHYDVLQFSRPLLDVVRGKMSIFNKCLQGSKEPLHVERSEWALGEILT